MFGRDIEMMTLKALLADLDGGEMPLLTDAVAQKIISQLTVDSRDAIAGSAFIALAGFNSHGMTYAEQAVAKGAHVILAEKSPGLVKMDSVVSVHHQGQQLTVPVIWLADLAKRCANLAKRFYGHLSRQLKVIGVTGTNGKTSTAHYIAQLLSASGFKVGLLGTLGNGWLGALTASQNTTLDVITLNRWLAFFAGNQADIVVMEVSSHAISLARIAGIEFCGVALTQVTRDHLDFHHTEQAYQSVKKQLFADYPSQFQVLNLDDAIGRELAEESTLSSRKLGYSWQKSSADIYAMSSMLYEQGMKGALTISQTPIKFDVPLMGQFNLENMLCAIGVNVGLGLSAKQIEAALTHLKPVAGRMQCLRQFGMATVVIDYAHTPDALQALLIAVRAHLSSPNQKLWLVFGCGGDRDQGKRPLMGQVAEDYADKVILTDDNPRCESPQHIVQQISAAMQKPFQVIHDRAEAVATVIAQASPGDVVVLAGKGHESTQEIAGRKIPMQDENLVNQAYQCKRNSL